MDTEQKISLATGKTSGERPKRRSTLGNDYECRWDESRFLSLSTNSSKENDLSDV